MPPHALARPAACMVALLAAFAAHGAEGDADTARGARPVMTNAMPLQQRTEDRNAAGLRTVTLRNAGFEEDVPQGDDPPGWVTGQHAGDLSYTFNIDERERHGGKRSLRIDNIGNQPYGAIYQLVPPNAVAGRKLRLTAWVKAENTGDKRKFSGVALQVQGKHGGAPVAFNPLQQDVVRGSFGWTERVSELVIPATGIDRVEVGIMLVGPGRIWVDDMKLELLDP